MAKKFIDADLAPIYLNSAACEQIKYMPAADVQEVRHGKWIKEENGVIICSECGEEYEWDDYRSSYCEFCGARMDGEENDD